MRVGVSWEGDEVADAEVAAAIPWVLHECLEHLAHRSCAEAVAAVDVGSDGAVALRLAATSLALVPEGDPPWLVRSRARVALSGGRLLCGRAGSGSFLEVRFPPTAT